MNPVTNRKIEEFFIVRDENYYIMINIDRTIRGNKLFKGSNFSKIKSIIDLKKWESLIKFKRKNKQLCNALKDINKREHYRWLKSRNNDISPYMNQEGLKILEKRSSF